MQRDSTLLHGEDGFSAGKFAVPLQGSGQILLGFGQRRLGVGYLAGGTLFNGLTLRGGVENVGDVEPPFFPSYTQSNTDPSQYDVLGRRYFVGVNYAFGGNK